MNLDELVNSIPEYELRAQLSHWVDEWKSDESGVKRLSDLIRKWHGNVSFRDPQSQDEFYVRFQQFQNKVVENIGGMTVNERLYWFGLFDHWDSRVFR